MKYVYFVCYGICEFSGNIKAFKHTEHPMDVEITELEQIKDIERQIAAEKGVHSVTIAVISYALLRRE